MAGPFRIVFILYPQLTQLDFTGPYEVLWRIPGVEVTLASKQGGSLTAESGLCFSGLAKLADVAGADLIMVPGGPGQSAAMLDREFMAEVKRLGEGARYVTSVCTGSLILAAAGLLAGKRAGAHWAYRELLPRFGIETQLHDGTDLSAWEAALAKGAKAVFMETPSNPTLEVIDIRAVSELAHAAGASVIVDNVFATPLLQRPLELGADIVVYSATKHIDGQGRCLGGAVLADAAFCTDILEPFLRHTGPALSPFNAWVLLKGLETLEVRVERQCRTATILAGLLPDHAGVARVSYPALPDFPQADLYRRQMAGGGTLMSFDIRGGRDAAFRVLDSLRLIDISNNLGDSKSLIAHPASSTHRSMGPEGRAAAGIGDGLLRLSAGLEDADDLAEDLAAALDAA